MKRFHTLLLALLTGATSFVPSGHAQEAADETHYTTTVFAKEETGGFSNYYRIPAIEIATDGTLIAAADARYNQLADLPQKISVVVKTSKDLGKTWSDIKVVKEGTAYSTDTYGDPALVVNPKTGTVFCFFSGNNGFFQSTKENPQHLFMSKSADNGETWSEAIDLTGKIYQDNWLGAFFTSGRALCTSDGKVMIAMPVRLEGNTSCVYVAMTSDEGETWEVSSPATPLGISSESKLVELTDGTILLSMRNPGYRKFSKSKDGGHTWTTTLTDCPDLVEPGCNGDIIRYPSTDGMPRLLHSVPNRTNTANAHGTMRENVSIFVSYDEGRSWPLKKSIVETESAYSSLVVLPDGSIGIFIEEGWWEGGLQGGAINALNPGFDLRFHRLALSDIEGGGASANPSPGYLDCDGSRYMRIPNDDAFTIPANGKFTVTYRSKMDAWAGANSYYGFVCNNYRDANNNRVGFDLFCGSSAAQTLGLNASPDNGSSTDATNFGGKFIESGYNIGEWNHVAWTYDGTTGESKMYINGTVLRETTNANNGMPITSLADILVGARYTVVQHQASTVNYILNGQMDDVRFYGDALSAEEVVADAEGAVEGKTLIAAYDFADIDGTTVPDVSGNGHDGVLVGFPGYSEGEGYILSVVKPEPYQGTLEVLDGETALSTGSRVAEGTELTITATPAEGFILSAIYVNGQAYTTSPVTYTVAGITSIYAEFERDPNAPVTYQAPSGNMHAEGKAYVTSITTEGADVNIERTWEETPDAFYQVLTDKIETHPGATFTLHLDANVAGPSSAVHQDLRYNRAFLFTDWAITGQHTQETVYGEPSPANNIAANYDTVLGIAHEFSVPEDAAIGESRIRVIYQNAWRGLSGANAQNVEDGMAYDIPVVVKSATAITAPVAGVAEGPVEYFNLQGIKVTKGNLVPGVYIVRQGTKASKVLIGK